MSQRVIFLDIDGVLNSTLWFQNRWKYKKVDPRHDISQKHMLLLNKLCADTGAVVVISSAWRILYELEDLKEIFKKHGATFQIIGYTPNIRHKGSVRGNEIKIWIDDNVERLFGIKPSNFNSYIILDDSFDFLLEQDRHFFHCDYYVGLTPGVCYRVKRFFEGKETISNSL